MFENITGPPSIASQCSLSSVHPSLLPPQHPISHPSPPLPGQDSPALPLPSFTYSPYTALGHRPASCASPSCPACLPALLVLPACSALHRAALPVLPACIPACTTCLPCSELRLHRPIPATGGKRCSRQQTASFPSDSSREAKAAPPSCGCAPSPGATPGRAAGEEGVAGAALPGRAVTSPV